MGGDQSKYGIITSRTEDISLGNNGKYTIIRNQEGREFREVTMTVPKDSLQQAQYLSSSFSLPIDTYSQAFGDWTDVPTAYINNDPLKFNLMNEYEIIDKWDSYGGVKDTRVRVVMGITPTLFGTPDYVIQYSFEVLSHPASFLMRSLCKLHS